MTSPGKAYTSEKMNNHGNQVQVVVKPPNWDDMGPAMRDCTAQQRVFVTALLDGGSHMKPTDAAALAGFSNPRAYSHELMQMSRVQAAIKEVALAKLKSSALIGADVLISLAQDMRAPHSVQLKAAERLLDQADLIVATKHEVSVEHKLTREQKILKAIQVCKLLGLDPREKLGLVGITVDAEFREIKSAEIAEIEADPLADILG